MIPDVSLSRRICCNLLLCTKGLAFSVLLSFGKCHLIIVAGLIIGSLLHVLIQGFWGFQEKSDLLHPVSFSEIFCNVREELPVLSVYLVNFTSPWEARVQLHS